MKKLLIILLCLPMIGFGQFTYVPDDIFENYLENNGLGDGVYLNDSVFTSAIDTLNKLDIPNNYGVNDLTGIKDFIAMTFLKVDYQNISELDVSGLTNLQVIYARNNNINILNLSGVDSLHRLYVRNNNITEIDLSNHYNITALNCSNNNLVCLNIGDNIGFTQANHPSSSDWVFSVSGNIGGQFGMPSLTCIQTTNIGWCQANLSISTYMNFSSSCDTNCTLITSNIFEYDKSPSLIKKINFLGKESKGIKNQPLFYIYDDGTVEKRITID